MIEVRNYIGGEWVGASDGATRVRVNPAATGETVSVAPDSTAADAERAVEYVAAHHGEWAATAPEKRAEVLSRAATLLEGRAAELAELIAREEGKTLAEAKVEASRTPANFRMYAQEALRISGQTLPSGDGTLIATLREPIGVVVAITPWNFPLNIPSRKLGPALAAGCGVVFKPSELTPAVSQLLVQVLLDAGVPGGALALVHGGGAVGSALVAHPQTRAVTFTGSTAVGEAIHRAAPVTVRTQLEMGGKNALVVAADADLDRAVGIIMRGAYGLTGQACTGTSRVIVLRERADELVEALAAKLGASRVGSGLAEGTTMGPLASQAQFDKYADYLAAARASDAVEVSPLAEADLGEEGWFVRPVLFRGVDAGDRLANEEVFGPILAVLEVDTLDEAIDLVNATEYGLSSGIVTQSLATALDFARRAQTGLVKVNQPTNGMAMNAPFGGVKMSSNQTFKEQGGAGYMDFYTVEKTVYFTP